MGLQASAPAHPSATYTPTRRFAMKAKRVSKVNWKVFEGNGLQGLEGENRGRAAEDGSSSEQDWQDRLQEEVSSFEEDFQGQPAGEVGQSGEPGPQRVAHQWLLCSKKGHAALS